MMPNIRQNVFARGLVSSGLCVARNASNQCRAIANLCDISLEAATYRAERMAELERRNAFYLHPLERRVKEQFADFINKKENPHSGTVSGQIRIREVGTPRILLYNI